MICTMRVLSKSENHKSFTTDKNNWPNYEFKKKKAAKNFTQFHIQIKQKSKKKEIAKNQFL